MLLNTFCHCHRAYASGQQLLGRKLPLNWGCPVTVYSGVFLLSYFVWSFTEASGLAFAEDTTLGWKDPRSLLPTSDISGTHKIITFLLAAVHCWQTSILWFKWFSFFCNVSMSFGLRFSFGQEIMFTKPLKEIRTQTQQLLEIKM